MRLSPFCLSIDASFASQNLDEDQRFFWRALKNAQFAMGTTHPNPAVGAVLVKDGVVLADGYTHPPGGMHAEKHAIACATSSPQGATLYVTLEPCSHFGRTPPCANAVIDAGVARVVYGSIDPNPKVCGQGLAALQKAGIETEQINDASLRHMADAMLAPFASWVLEKRPYVVVKIATSADGYFAKGYGNRTKITGPQANELVHALRRGSDAIMVGGSTARIDDPELTARGSYLGQGQQPASIIVSAQGTISSRAKLCNRGAHRSLIMVSSEHAATLAEDLAGHKVEIVVVDAGSSGIDLDAGFRKLGELGYTLVFVEAGPRLFTELVQRRLADEILWFRSREEFRCDGPGIANLQELITSNYSQGATRSIGDDDMTIFFAPSSLP